MNADREEQDPGISNGLHYNGLHANRWISPLLGAVEARAHRRKLVLRIDTRTCSPSTVWKAKYCTCMSFVDASQGVMAPTRAAVVAEGKQLARPC